MKRIVSLILSAAMCLSMTMGAAATEVTGLDAMHIRAEEEYITSVEFDEPFYLYSFNPFVEAMSSIKLDGIKQLDAGSEIQITNDSTIQGDFVYVYLEEYTKSETSREFEEWDYELEEYVTTDYKGKYVSNSVIKSYDIKSGDWEETFYIEPSQVYDSGNYLNPGESVSVTLPKQENVIYKLYAEIYNIDGSNWFHKYVYCTYDNFAPPEEIIGNDEMWLQGNTVTVNCEDYGACNVVIALYDGDGKLIAVEMKPATVTDDTVSVKFDKDQIESMADASAFILSDDNTLVPLDKKIVLNTTGEPEPTFESVDEEIANLIALNNDELPEIYCGSEDTPSFIMGTFSGETVNSAEDAIDALNDIHNIMQLENAAQEFEEVYSETVDFGEETNFYRLQQTYKDIPVYGHQVIVSADAEGVTQTMSGNYFPGIDLDVTPILTEEEAKAVVEAETVESLTSEGLCIYVQDDTAVLCWQIGDAESSHFVDAKTGEIVDVLSEIACATTNLVSVNVENRNDPVDIPIKDLGDGKYMLRDDERNIIIADANFVDTEKIFKETESGWSDNKNAISAYINMRDTYDYYADNLGRNGADGKGLDTYVVVNYRKSNAKTGRYDPYNNAHFTNGTIKKDVDGDEEKENVAYFVIGEGNTYAQALDVIAHEFTHAVTFYTWGGEYSGESGALNESYSDILAELIQDGILDECGETLKGGAIRSFIDPSIYKHPMHYKDYIENGDVHKNSGILNYAAYLMEQEWPTSNGRAEELAKLFYTSMFYLHPKATFNDCYCAIQSAARKLNLNQAKMDAIEYAFVWVGIPHMEQTDKDNQSRFTGEIRDAETNLPIEYAFVHAIDKSWFGDRHFADYSDENGKFNIAVTTGSYNLEISHGGYESRSLDTKWMFFSEKDLGTIYLVPSSVTVAGKITNQQTDEGVEAAKIKFRAGADNKTGDYIRNEDGVIVVYTNSEGEFSTEALGRGTYTMEVSADGYKTGYMNIEAGSPESGIGVDLNVALAPSIYYDVNGLVACDENTAELNNIIVEVTDIDGNYVTLTNVDADGTYFIQLEAGTYTLEFSGAGYETVSVELTVDENGQYTLPTVTIKVAELPMPTALSGSVNKMGYCFDVWTPITNATITLANESGREESVESTDGTFTFEEYDRTQVHKLTVNWYNSVQMSNITITVDIPVGYDLREDFTIAFKSKNVAGFNSEENKYRDRLKYGLIVYSKNDYELIVPEESSTQ